MVPFILILLIVTMTHLGKKPEGITSWKTKLFSPLNPCQQCTSGQILLFELNILAILFGGPWVLLSNAFVPTLKDGTDETCYDKP